MVARILLTADDGGVLPAIDDAIIDLTCRGKLTRVSAFPNGPTFVSLLSRLPRSTCVIPHLTLTYGCPIGPAAPLRGLLNEYGQFRQPLDYYRGDINEAIAQWCRNCYSTADVHAADKEIQRQMLHHTAIVGHQPKSTAFHHDIDAIVPTIYSECAIPSFNTGRAAAYTRKDIAGYLSRSLADDLDDVAVIESVVVLIEAGIELSQKTDLPAEVVFHPAAHTAGLSDFTAYEYGRVREYQALLSNEIASVLQDGRRVGAFLEFVR